MRIGSRRIGSDQANKLHRGKIVRKSAPFTGLEHPFRGQKVHFKNTLIHSRIELELEIQSINFVNLSLTKVVSGIRPKKSRWPTCRVQGRTERSDYSVGSRYQCFSGRVQTEKRP